MGIYLVSIICNTYNHEEYIAKTIDSFVMQQTNFKFEILIHDDASTDRTAQIIRDYEKCYPDLIKAICQNENQRSKGISVTKLNIARAQGKYIAFCEGDDYWTDPYKLQKQVEYMEAHPECSLCVHGGYVVNSSDETIIGKHQASKKNQVFTVEQVIEGGGGLFLTNSMVFPKKFAEVRPKFFDLSPVGDYPLAISLSLLGTVYYIDEIMSAYRANVRGSWTTSNLSTIEKRTKHFQLIAVMLDEIDHYTNYQYKDAIKRTKNNNQFNLLLDQGKFQEARSGEYAANYLALSYKNRIRIFINQYCPNIYKILRFLKRRWIRWSTG